MGLCRARKGSKGSQPSGEAGKAVLWDSRQGHWACGSRGPRAGGTVLARALCRSPRDCTARTLRSCRVHERLEKATGATLATGTAGDPAMQVEWNHEGESVDTNKMEEEKMELRKGEMSRNVWRGISRVCPLNPIML